MKKMFFWTLLFFLFVCCTSIIDDKNNTGNVYGVVTISTTAEPVRAAGVSLFVVNDYSLNAGGSQVPNLSLLLKTVTYDDGHFEFNDIEPGDYYLTVELDGYDLVKMSITVEAGRTARADMQMSKIDTGLTVKTGIPTVNVTTVAFEGNYSSRKNSPDEYGFVYGNNQNPTKEKDIVIKAAKYFVAEANVEKKGVYHVRAYATNSLGTTYGEDVSFEIIGSPIVTTLNANNIQDKTATLNGRIEYKGDPVYSEKGFVYSSSYSSPTIDDPESATQRITVKGNSDDFSANIAGLIKNSKYYVRAYVINANYTVYGESISFIATSDRPYVVIDALAVQKTDISSGTTWSQAGSLCHHSQVGGYSDWRLPSLGELSVLYTNRSMIGGFYNSKYWSGSNFGSNYSAGAIDFSTGVYDTYSTTCSFRVRCVRSL